MNQALVWNQGSEIGGIPHAPYSRPLVKTNGYFLSLYIEKLSYDQTWPSGGPNPPCGRKVGNPLPRKNPTEWPVEYMSLAMPAYDHLWILGIKLPWEKTPKNSYLKYKRSNYFNTILKNFPVPGFKLLFLK